MANNPEVGPDRRKLLVGATAVTGGAVFAGTAAVFIQTMSPSEAVKAAGAPVEVDISTLAPGELMTVEFRGKPVWILHRSEQMLAQLNKNTERLADPLSKQDQQPPYASNPTRSIRPAYMVMTAICTHLGCVPVYRPETVAPDMGPDWTGGFYCPCHGSRFDLAGRVYQNVPAPTNLEIPPHQYLRDDRILIGADASSPA